MRLLLAILSAIASATGVFICLFAACAGVAWIYLFGDDPWPSWSWVVLIVPPAVAAILAGVNAFRKVMG